MSTRSIVLGKEDPTARRSGPPIIAVFYIDCLKLALSSLIPTCPNISEGYISNNIHVFPCRSRRLIELA